MSTVRAQVPPRHRIPPQQRHAIAQAFAEAKQDRTKNAAGVVAQRFGVGRSAVAKFHLMLLQDQQRGIDEPECPASAFCRGTHKQVQQRRQRYERNRLDLGWVHRQRGHKRATQRRVAERLALRNRCRTWQELFRTMLNDASRRRWQGIGGVGTEDLFDILAEQDGKCALSGLLLQNEGPKHNPLLASIDRIDSECGYQLGNVQLLCFWVNRMKRDFLQHDIRAVLQHAAAFQRGQAPPAEALELAALQRQATRLYHTTRSRSVQLEREFDLTAAFLRQLLQQQGGRCALSGVPMQAGSRVPLHPCQVSVDRIDSGRGYTRDNVQLVALCMNLGKGNTPDEQFRAVLRAMTV